MLRFNNKKREYKERFYSLNRTDDAGKVMMIKRHAANSEVQQLDYVFSRHSSARQFLIRVKTRKAVTYGREVCKCQMQSAKNCLDRSCALAKYINTHRQ